MGLSSMEFNFLFQAYQKGCLPRGGTILEFGECEVMSLNVPAALHYALPEGPERDSFVQEAEALKAQNGPMRAYDECKLIYRAFFDYSDYAAIDLAPGQPHRIQQDLNKPFNLGRQFDICINNGTSEHLFDQANFFKAVHDHTKQGGTMLHWTPCLGYADHGFYNVQPSFFHDLAAANDYEVQMASLVSLQKIYELAPFTVTQQSIAANPDLKEAELCVIMKKRGNSAFEYPLQRAFRRLDKFREKRIKTD